ncbi:MAG: chorismate mutase [Peptococcaceae bacterium]|jgi:chorismate mutase/prephenate dehydratase|nr:chorismate mutase [Peptococcaceae bacterium]
MSGKEELAKLRQQIDEIDEGMIALFQERLDIAGQVAAVKGKNNIAIWDEERERQVVERAADQAPAALRGEVALLMRSVVALCREHERELLLPGEDPLLPPARPPIREDTTCVFQGVPGAWSEQALMRLYPAAKKQAAEFFEDVFLAVKEKKADYGVVPIENSKTGAIGETYDLLRKYGCYIVGRTWVDIHHCLLAPAGVGLADIREVYSHSEGFRQCGKFLRGRAWDLAACRNTAVAAEIAAAAGNGKTAAIGSRRAAELNGLRVLAPDIMDAADNRTSFVAIAGAPEYSAGDNLISITFSTQHRSGALCGTLMPFMAGGLNLLRIESRPGSAGNFRFFAEVEGNILSERVIAVLRHCAATCEYFEVIGCYSNH